MIFGTWICGSVSLTSPQGCAGEASFNSDGCRWALPNLRIRSWERAGHSLIMSSPVTSSSIFHPWRVLSCRDNTRRARVQCGGQQDPEISVLYSDRLILDNDLPRPHVLQRITGLTMKKFASSIYLD